MFDLVKRLLIAKELEFEEGRIAFFKQRMQLVDPAFFAYRLKHADDFWKEAYLQYNGMKEANIKAWFEPVKKEKGIRGDELVKWATKYHNLAGWGDISFEATQIKEGRAKVRILRSPIATIFRERFGKSSDPVCHLNRGGIAGGASVIIGLDLDVIETRCLAQGHSQCEMIVRPKNEFRDLREEVYQKQLHIL